MKSNTIGTVVAGVLAVAALVVALLNGGTVVQTIGAQPGPDHTELQFFKAGLVDGGGVYSTTTTVASETLTAAVLQKNKVIRMLGSSTAAAITLTLPASTTMNAVLPKPGDYRTWVIENGYTAAATTTTIAAGTGMDLQEPDGQNVVIGINNYAFLTCFREASTDIVCAVDETIPAD